MDKKEENLYEIPVYKTVETFVHIVASSQAEAIQKVQNMDDTIMVLPSYIQQFNEDNK